MSGNLGEDYAVIYSLLQTCKANGIEPYQYFKHVLAALPVTLNADIDRLLPLRKNKEKFIA